MRLTPLDTGGGLVDAGPHQWVPHGHGVATDHQQPGPLRLLQGVRTDTERGSRTLDGGEPSGVIGDGDQHQRLRRPGQAAAAVEEDLLDARGQHQLGRERRRPRQLGLGEARRQLHEGQRVAPGLGQQPVADLGRHGDRCRSASSARTEPASSPCRRSVGTPSGVKARSSLSRAAKTMATGSASSRRVANSRRRTTPHPASARRRRCTRGAGPRPPRSASTGSRPRPGTVRRGSGLLTERDAQRMPLRLRQRAHAVEDRAEQAVQGRVGERRLRLQTLCAQHTYPGRGRHDLRQECGLPDAGFSQDHDAAGRPAASGVEERGQPRPLGLSPMQHVEKVARIPAL